MFLNKNKSKTDFTLSTNFLIAPRRGYVQLQDEQVPIQIKPQGPPEIFFKVLAQNLMFSVFGFFNVCVSLINCALRSQTYSHHSIARA